MSKASKEELNNLHGKVAKSLSDNLDDPKVLAMAIQFLKNNSINVDELPAETETSLFTKIQALTTKPNKDQAVEDILKLHA